MQHRQKYCPLIKETCKGPVCVFDQNTDCGLIHGLANLQKMAAAVERIVELMPPQKD